MKRLLLPLLFVVAPVLASGEVYEWTDSGGIRHFSSSRSHKDAQPASLPPLMKEPVKSKLAPLKSCGGHGGINCQAGADSDGSVVCYDGFKEAAGRFRFACNTPKLLVTDVSAAEKDGSFKVYIRNEASVKAEGTKVVLRSVEGKEVAGEGPDAVEPLAMAEFIFKTSLQSGQKPAVTNFEATCSNCG